MKKFIISIIFTSIVFFWLYFFIWMYDQGWQNIQRILDNIYYFIFLYISIIFIINLEWKNSKISKIVSYFLIIINILYIIFVFLIWNMWLTKTTWLIFIISISIWFLSTFIKNWIWYIIITISMITNIIILFLSVIPLYETWIDTTHFENQYNTNLVIYSDIWINKNNAYIQTNKKSYTISEWINNYNFFADKSWSQILFKSDEIYENTNVFLVFKWWEFVQITPQSAIKIDDSNNIEIIDWDILYRPDNYTNFSFTWDNTGTLVSNSWNIEIIKNRYDDKLKLFVKIEVWSVKTDPIILKISKKTLEILFKFRPKYEENLLNLQSYVDLFNINLDDDQKSNNIFDNKEIYNNFIWNIKKWIDSIR